MGLRIAERAAQCYVEWVFKASFERYQEKPFFGSSHNWAKQHIIRLPKGISALDIGAGSGVMGKAIANHGCAKRVAVEIDPPTKERIRPLYDEVIDNLEVLEGQKFDLILLLDILEHLPTPEALFSQAWSLLNPGGIVLVSVPNVAHWSVRLSLLCGYFEGTDRGILDRTHLQFFTRRRFFKLLHSVNPESVEFSGSIVPIEFLLPEAMIGTWPLEIFAKLRHFSAKVFPTICAYQHLACATKKGA